jgi:lysophospholipase L1-like esterase
MLGWLKSLAINATLVVISFVLAYLAVELIFFRLVLGNVQLAARPYLPETAGALVQKTKAGLVPHNYVAILGDSYAEGWGDESLKAGDDFSRWFSATDVVHKLTGRDVVTFGKAGAGSAEAFVMLLSRTLEGSRCATFPSIGDPDQVFAYFYEGNDLGDNSEFAKRVRAKYGQAGTQEIDAYLSNQYAAYPWWRCHVHLADVASRMTKFYYAYFTGQTALPYKPQWPYGPFMDLDEKEIGPAIMVFDRSLAWLRRRLPHTKITVVYVPSPLSIYLRLGSSVAYDDRNFIGSFTAERVLPRAKQICELVRSVSVRAHVGFADTGPALREAAMVQPIHGPLDWVHFNERGYRAFGKMLALQLAQPAIVDPCE